MGLRPGRCYSSKKDRAFSRYAVKVHSKNYIGATPGLKTRQFNMGNPAKKFSHILDLIGNDHKQVRDNAFESARIAINRFLNKKLGSDKYFMRIRVYPFQILRENKQAQGAGADRVSQGMSLSFGTVIGRAVRLRPGQKLISVLVDEKDVPVAKEALLRARARMPLKLTVRIGTDVESIGTRPKQIKEIVEEEKPAEEAKEGEKKEGKGEAGKEKKEGKKEEGKEKKAEEAKEGKAGKGKEESGKEGKKEGKK
ncbi:MAG: 50S ribosomal protein L16 [Candidatus Diapherotrites archaeon]|uniref:50S ribosomal protein L16 n=1 Tax=Candidatus Iainarchaeum sp. TaxID=3101447 RepID=A0A939C7R5_9ARCH|nr:50S ribosomal protein L16 [Candidatus Diapherotrites archaeon]